MNYSAEDIQSMREIMYFTQELISGEPQSEIYIEIELQTYMIAGWTPEYLKEVFLQLVEDHEKDMQSQSGYKIQGVFKGGSYDK